MTLINRHICYANVLHNVVNYVSLSLNLILLIFLVFMSM